MTAPERISSKAASRLGWMCVVISVVPMFLRVFRAQIPDYWILEEWRRYSAWSNPGAEEWQYWVVWVGLLLFGWRLVVLGRRIKESESSPMDLDG